MEVILLLEAEEAVMGFVLRTKKSFLVVFTKSQVGIFDSSFEECARKLVKVR